MAYCGTEQLICLNVAAGRFLGRKGILRIQGTFAVETGLVYKNLNQYGLNLAIKTMLRMDQNSLVVPQITHK